MLFWPLVLPLPPPRGPVGGGREAGLGALFSCTTDQTSTQQISTVLTRPKAHCTNPSCTLSTCNNF
jgi:hypothetical protein